MALSPFNLSRLKNVYDNYPCPRSNYHGIFISHVRKKVKRHAGKSREQVSRNGILQTKNQMAAQPRPLSRKQRKTCTVDSHMWMCTRLAGVYMMIYAEKSFMIIQDRKEIVWKMRKQKMTPPLKMQTRKAASPPTQSVRLASPNAIYVRSLLHTNEKRCSDFHHSINVHPSEHRLLWYSKSSRRCWVLEGWEEDHYSFQPSLILDSREQVPRSVWLLVWEVPKFSPAKISGLRWWWVHPEFGGEYHFSMLLEAQEDFPIACDR